LHADAYSCTKSRRFVTRKQSRNGGPQTTLANPAARTQKRRFRRVLDSDAESMILRWSAGAFLSETVLSDALVARETYLPDVGWLRCDRRLM